MIETFIMSAKVATLGLLNLKVSVHDITNKSLSSDTNYIVNVII